MKRIITISILLFCSLAGLLAVNVTPYYDPFDSMDDVFTSPIIINKEVNTTLCDENQLFPINFLSVEINDKFVLFQKMNA